MNICLLKQGKAFGVALALAAGAFTVQPIAGVARAQDIQVPDAPSSSIIASSSTLPESSSSSPEVSDEVIDRFLFHVRDEALWEKIKKTLDTNPVVRLRIPVLFGVATTQIEDTWGVARSGGRVHEGTDIIAPRGAFIVSPTDAVVTNTGNDRRGGNYVLTANPGGEQFYYAHLERIAVGVMPGKVLAPGDLIGYVGNTGNARRAAPHLHFGIYYKGIATNSYPRLAQEFSLEERVAALAKIVDESDVALATALQVMDDYKDFLVEAQLKGFAFPNTITWLLENNEVLMRAQMLSAGMALKTQSDGVRFLQELLIQGNTGPAARALAKKGATGYFGVLTQNALAEYQKTVGITPAFGHFGPATRARMLNLLAQQSTSSQIAFAEPQNTNILPQVVSIDRDLAIGAEGDAVQLLQQFLIETHAGSAALALAHAGATGYFGPRTRDALADYQAAVGIIPARGYFGSITRARIQNLSTHSE